MTFVATSNLPSLIWRVLTDRLSYRSRFSRWTTTKRSASSPDQSCTTSSLKPNRHSKRWTRICKSDTRVRSTPAKLLSPHPHDSYQTPTSHHQSHIPTNNPIPSEKRDLAQLSSLGHFLKGSSATLGMTKVKDSCEKIQHFGAHKSADGSKDVEDDDECLDNLKKIIKQAKQEFAEVEKRLRQFYEPGSA